MIHPIELPRKTSSSLQDHASALGRGALGFCLSQSDSLSSHANPLTRHFENGVASKPLNVVEYSW